MLSAGAARRYSHVGSAIGCGMLLAACTHQPRPLGELVLDAADPVIQVRVAGVPLRLRVDLDRYDGVELDPGAAARLPLAFEPGSDLEVGRIHLPGSVATATLVLGDVTLPVQLVRHARDCCAGADGAIGPALLPYAAVRWRRADAPRPGGSVNLPLDEDAVHGLSAAGAAGVRLRFALGLESSSATAAAGAVLWQAQGGRWDGPPSTIATAFGLVRPARSIAFARPATLAGFRFDALPVRIADFGGGAALPQDPRRPDEILVSRAVRSQEAWPAVTIGQDRLRACAEIVYTARPRTLTLRCAFSPWPG